MPCRLPAVLMICCALACGGVHAAGELRLATTTSTENSGLLNAILPQFEAQQGIRVRVLSTGSGKALKLGENGDVDVVLVHSPADEERFVAAGFGIERSGVMYNDFVVVGPPSDPAAVRGNDVLAAFTRIAGSAARFVSRGDDSGTDRMEKSCWRAIGVEPAPHRWYVSAGLGMGQVLTMAAEMRAYTLTDRATYATYRARTGLEILVSGDSRLFNPYSVIAVNPARHPGVNHAGAMRFIEWLTGDAGQRAIGAFRLDGEALFLPNAR
jgi:tungstate transport system substrate-binding protein